jgi:hypothetical protein
MYEWHLVPMPMKYFLPLDRNRPAWVARIRALESPGEREDNSTVVAMSGYLLALDDLCDQLGQRVRSLIKRAEEAETRWRKAWVVLAKAEAQAANTESRDVLAEEDIREEADRHSQLLRGVYLVDRAKRKNRTGNGDESPILEGVPMYHLASPRRRICEPVPPTPPTSPREDKADEGEDPTKQALGEDSQADVPVDP